MQSARLKAATKRAPRVKRVRKAGVHVTKAAVLARAHVVAVAEYGGEVLGWSDTALQIMRTAVHTAVTPRPSGRSLTADLQLASPSSEFGADPGVRACTSPIFFWLSILPASCPFGALALAFVRFSFSFVTSIRFAALLSAFVAFCTFATILTRLSFAW